MPSGYAEPPGAFRKNPWRSPSQTSAAHEIGMYFNALQF
jgi:hypothetical protein